MAQMTVWRLMVVAAAGLSCVSAGCPTMTACTCTASGNDYEIFCHVDGIQLSIRWLPQRYYTVECETYHADFDLSKIPKFPLEYTNLQTVSFDQCPLPKTSLGEVISSLGVTRATAVKFQSSYNSSSIQRKHLEGLDDLKTTRITLTGSGFTDLPVDLFADNGNLTWLGLLSTNVRIPKGFFENLPKLEILELRSNHLTDIPEDMLSHLYSLKKLYLWHNNIQKLTKPVFKGLTQLKDLDLSINDLKELPQEIFQHLEQLRTISLLSNNFTSLPSNIFSHNKELEKILLFNNNVNLTSLPEYFLSDMKQLKEVELYRIGLEIIPENAFANSSHILNISLAENNIEKLPSGLFQDQTDLIKLDLRRNRIKDLPHIIFRSQRALEILDLSENLIENVSSDFFVPLIKLTNLYMKHNRLKRLGHDIFNLAKSLTLVDMSHNHLDFQDLQASKKQDIYSESLSQVSPFQGATNLQKLDLSHNLITTIYTDWRIILLNLVSLDLSYNAIVNLQYQDFVFHSRHNLLVDLTHNNISTLQFRNAQAIALGSKDQEPDARSQRSKPNHNVKFLIDDNPFKCDCLLTWFVQYLCDELDPQVYASMNIDVGDATCAASPSGKDLQGRKLKSVRPEELFCPLDDTESQRLCPNECDCFVRLYDYATIQECSNGATNHVPELPRNLNYTELYLNNNGLTRLVRKWDMPEYVTKMYLNDNNLTELSLGDVPKNIEVLNLKNNRLRHLNASIAEMVVNGSRLRELWMSGNPIACDCSNIVLLGLLQKHRNKVKDYDQLYCEDGKSVRYLAIGSLCGADPGTIGASVVIALLGLLVGIAAAAYYKYNHEIKVFLFAKGWLLWFVTEEELDKDKQYDAFISFSYKDEEFVVNKLISPLEKGATPFKLCVHFRDWIAGEVIPEQIAKSVKASRRTVVVLSPNFLDSVWGRLEFRTAHNQALREGRARVIIIIYGDIGDISNLDPELQAYLSTNTYVKWGDPWFWDKLRYALPHPTHRLARNVTHVSISKKKGFDDRLELIHRASPTTPPALNTPPAHLPQVLAAAPAPPPTKFPAQNGHANGHITMNGLKVNGNAKHSEV